MLQSRVVKAATFATCASLAFALPANAQELTLKFAHQFPASHYLWTQGGEVFADKVAKASGGSIKFQVYPAAQLGKEYFRLLRAGLADMAIFIPSYEAEKLPMSSVAALPGMFSSACQGTRNYWNLAREGGILGDSEYKAQGLHVLFVTSLPPYTIMTTRKETGTIDSLHGLKIRANGAAMTKTVRALGAVPVPVTSPELYDALSRGMIDGAIFPYNGLPDYNLQDELKHSVNGPGLGGPSVAYAISIKTWNKLTPEQQDIFTEAAHSTQASLCQWLETENAKVRKQIVAKDGHVITTLSPQERTRWQAKMNGVADEWAADMDKAGRPGTQVLKAYRAAAGDTKELANKSP